MTPSRTTTASSPRLRGARRARAATCVRPAARCGGQGTGCADHRQQDFVPRGPARRRSPTMPHLQSSHPEARATARRRPSGDAAVARVVGRMPSTKWPSPPSWRTWLDYAPLEERAQLPRRRMRSQVCAIGRDPTTLDARRRRHRGGTPRRLRAHAALSLCQLRLFHIDHFWQCPGARPGTARCCDSISSRDSKVGRQAGGTSERA